MKIERHRADRQPLNPSPITPSGQIVISRIREESDPYDPKMRYIVTYTPDGEDVIKVLNFLNEMNGIGWTADLRRIEAELRAALVDLRRVSNG